MGRFVAGDVIFLRFPFDDLSSDKSRPALVLGAVGESQYLVAYVTSQEKQRSRGAIEITQEDLIDGELRKTSFIRPDILFTARDRIIRRKVGSISRDKHKMAVESLVRFVQSNLAERQI
ncbi:MAG: type II toxin-antitoxin system PemK/MazF family toxin [Rhodothermaceae bacterium]|nr:type II toxin-antitoxin system PemK/MazF family toxin [Rhodothermaceae bacterium]